MPQVPDQKSSGTFIFQRARRPERKQVTVLFADMENFTPQVYKLAA